MAPQLAVADPLSSPYDRFPYSAVMLDQDGEPMEGIVDVLVQVHEDISGVQTVVYQEFHGEVEIEDGRLSLVLGAGESSASTELVEVFSGMGNYAVEFFVDGESLGEVTPLGALPFAAYAGAVPAAGVRFGGAYGLLPEAAIPRMFEFRRAWYTHGESLPSMDGWRCEHVASIPETSQATSFGSAGLHGQDIFVAAIGPVAVPVLPGLTIDFSEVPGDPSAVIADENVVQTRQAFSSCTQTSWDPTCTWDVIEPVAMLPVEVESFCIPEVVSESP